MLYAEIGGATIAARTAGDSSKPALVLLHGWPQSSRAFDNVLPELGNDHFVLAFDLPGIGASQGAPPSAEKTVLAGLLLDAAEKLGARDILFAGYDVGGMIAYAAARDHANRISGAMVMNTVIPGIPPWAETLADPRIFHFALHALPELPELLVTGHQRQYFDFFYDIMAGDKSVLTEEARNEYARAYERPEALTAGFDWYRAMANDAPTMHDTNVSTCLFFTYAAMQTDGSRMSMCLAYETKAQPTSKAASFLVANTLRKKHRSN